MVDIMKMMATSFKRSHASLNAPNPAAARYQPLPPRPSQASLGQSLVRSLLLSPGSWCTQGSICAFQESVSPLLCKFLNQIPLVSKVTLSGGSQSLCQIPRLENLSWVLKLL